MIKTHWELKDKYYLLVTNEPISFFINGIARVKYNKEDLWVFEWVDDDIYYCKFKSAEEAMNFVNEKDIIEHIKTML